MTTLRWEVEGVKEMTDLTSELVKFRIDIGKMLKAANDVRVGLFEAICRTKIRKVEKEFTDLQERFIAYEEGLNNFLTKWFGPQVRFPNLESQISLTLYYSSLSSHRDGVRRLLQDVGCVVEDRRTRANNLLGFVLSIITLFVAVIAILIRWL